MEQNLRIALFSGNYNYVLDGANLALNKLVTYLEREGAEVLVLSPTTQTPAFEPAGTLISVNSIPVPLRGEYRIACGLSRRLKRKIKAFNPTLFHLSAPDLLGHSALKFSETLGVPAVASYHTRFDTYLQYYGFGWVAPYFRYRMAKFYNRCRHVYVPSRSVGDVLIKEGVLDEKYRIWSRGVDRERFNPKHKDLMWRKDLGLRDEDIVLGFVGRLVREKGLEEFANLVENLAKQGLPVKALVVGSGPDGHALHTRLPFAVMTGHLSGHDLAQAYASMDVYINPSLTETFGNVTLEAMASGTPTICANATGSVDLVQNGKTGMLVNFANMPEWSESLADICRDQNQLQRMGNQARLASAAFDWEHIMQALVDQYIEVLNQGRGQYA